jgi:hypothetical protein
MEAARRLLDRLFPRYQCFAVLGASQGEKAWFWPVWKQVYPAVSELASVLGAKASVHSRQIQGPRSAAVRFGVLPWTDEGQQQWAHHSPKNAAECGKWMFVDTQVFVPPRQRLIARGGSPFPAVYIQLSPEVEVPDRRTVYDQRMLVCMRLDVYRPHEDAVRSLLSVVRQQLRSVAMLAELRRVVSLNQFESILREDLDYRGAHQDPIPDLSKARGRWTLVEENRGDA